MRRRRPIESILIESIFDLDAQGEKEATYRRGAASEFAMMFAAKGRTLAFAGRALDGRTPQRPTDDLLCPLNVDTAATKVRLLQP